jgi:flagellar hook-length control protein FliK
MIALLKNNDIGVAGATDWLAKTGLESTKASVSAVENSFVQIMTSLEKVATPILSQMDMVEQGSEPPPTLQGTGVLDQTANDQGGALFLLAIASSVGSTRTVLEPQAVVAAGDDLPVAPIADMDAAAAVGGQPGDFWDVTQVTQIQFVPVDPDIMADQSTALQPVVLVGFPVDLQQLDLPHGDIGLPRAALVAVSPRGDATLVTASDPGFGDTILPVLVGGPFSVDGTVDGPITSMPDGSIVESVKKSTTDGWKLTVEQVTYQIVGPDAGSEPFAGAARVSQAENAVQITVSQQPVGADVLALQAGPSTAAAGGGPGDVVTQELAARAAAAGGGPGDVVTQELAARAAATPDTGAAPQILGEKKQGPARAQNDMMPVPAPDHAAIAIPMSKTAQLAAGTSMNAVQQVTLPRQPLAPTLGADPLLPTMTQIEIANGGAGSASQGGNGQAGSGVAGQAAAALQGQMEAALDVRQRGWTQILVNRAINAAQAGGALTIKILPAHLGQITLKLSEGKRGTDMRIVADVPATAAMLRDVQDQLSSAFENAGLTLGAYSASTGQNGDQDAQKDGYTDQVALSELAIDTVKNGDDMARADNLSRINILL